MLTDEYLFDVFRCASEQERTYDWGFHAIGTLDVPLKNMSAPQPNWNDEKVYRMVRDVSAATTDGTWSATWNLVTDPHWIAYKNRRPAQWTDATGEGRFLQVTMLGADGTEVRKARVPRRQTKHSAYESKDDEVDWHKQVFATRKSKSAMFAAAYETYRKAPAITEVQKLAVTGADGMAVSEADCYAARVMLSERADTLAVSFTPGVKSVDGVTFEAEKMVLRRTGGKVRWIYLARPKSLTVDGKTRTFEGKESVIIDF
jgi:hypothetical protein